MKLLFCIKALSTRGGGAERVMLDVAQGMSARGHEVVLVTFDPATAQSFYPVDPGLEWVRLAIGQVSEQARVGPTMARIAALRRTAKHLRPHAAIGFMHSMFVPLGLALLGTGIPVVASEHIVPAHYSSRPVEWVALQIMPLALARFTCVSPEVRDLYPRWIARKMVPIANPVTVRPAKDGRIAAPKKNLILSVGRLEPQKDHATLLSAFGLLAQEFPEWELRILGEGSLRAELMVQAEHLGIADRVHLPGAVEDIDWEYRQARVFVLPSRYESFGLTVAESLGYGLPAIGFADCAGVNRLIQPDSNGLLVSPGENRHTALAAALRSLLGNSDLLEKMSGNAAVISEENKLDQVVDAWERMIGGLDRRPSSAKTSKVR